MRKQFVLRGLAAVAMIVLFGCNHSNAPSSSETSNSSSGSSASNSSSNPTSTSSSATNNAPSAAPPPAPAPAPPPPIVVPAGRTLTVTIDQNVSTKDNSSGDAFAASLAVPVTVDGQTVIPSGTHVSGTVVQSQQAGRVKGGANLVLTLDSIRLNGQKIPIVTTQFEQSGKGRGKRTAVGGGGGAAFGAIVGGLAGGGKGAAIGALAGGGAGTAGAAYTGNRDITIPAETRVQFKLKQSVSIPQQ